MASSAVARMKKPRILCLHGRGLNGTYFRGQLGGLIRMAPSFEFYFLDGHLESQVAPEAANAWTVALAPNQRQAWQYFSLRQDPAAESAAARWQAGQDAGKGLHVVWDTVSKEVSAGGPFFAAIGFSQGANVAAALLARQAASGIDLGFRCTVNLCGGLWGMWPETPQEWWKKSDKCTPYLPLCGVPSLHVIGLGDPYLPQSRSLVEGYCSEDEGSERLVLEHPGGHVPFPHTAKERREMMTQVCSFLKSHAPPTPSE
eukprot:TRINITY_DN17189_c1_g3_i1.p1 TRINITY_DN17189_c1_g3~~TRINITY_DN17189_c1_g3_i1.p1  ORF type:complete len:267 (-),score=32.22 TRINITY_DN17189_c1_g3_i1:316-1089(-)